MMERLYENPSLPEGEDEIIADISLYMPHESIILKLISKDTFVSLIEYLDEDLLKTPPSSEDESSDDEIEIIDFIPFKPIAVEQHSDKVIHEEPVKEKDTPPCLTKDAEIERLGNENQLITIDEDTDENEDTSEECVMEKNIERIDLCSEDIQTSNTKLTHEELVKGNGSVPCSAKDAEIGKLANESEMIIIVEDSENEGTTEKDCVMEQDIEIIDLCSEDSHTSNTKFHENKKECSKGKVFLMAINTEEIVLDSDDNQTRTKFHENEKKCSKGKVSLMAINTEEIVLDSDDNKTRTKCERNHKKSKKITKRKSSDISVKATSKRRIGSEYRELVKYFRRSSTDRPRHPSLDRCSTDRRRSFIQSRDLVKFLRQSSTDSHRYPSLDWLSTDRRRSPSQSRDLIKFVRRSSTDRPRYPSLDRFSTDRRRSPSQSSYKRRSGHGNSIKRSPISYEYPKRMCRRCSSPDLLQYSPRRHRYSPHEPVYHSPRAQRRYSPQYAMDEKRRYKKRERYSSPENERNNCQQIIHYIDATSNPNFEVSEIKISSKLKPTCQETNEEKIQNLVHADPAESSLKADLDVKAGAFENYYCKDCQLTLNSKLTWESHIVGKKHKKAIQCQAIHEIAKGSIRVPPNPEFASMDKPRFANPTAGKKLLRLNERSRLQKAVDEETRYPMPGLDYVIEIRSENVITYYCELCDAPCQLVSIMPHIIGFNHQILSLKEIDRTFYEEVQHVARKKSIMRKLLGVLFNHQDRHGKGLIRVYEEKPDPNAISNPLESLYFDRPGPSWGNAPMKPEHEEYSESGANYEYLDTSKSDFYCKLCDSHMNNLNMWAAHVRGKRHLKNANKNPGEKPSKMKAVRAPPHYFSRLESMLRKEARREVIVGLDYIRETQSKNGEIYNCFLCCACATNYDIIDHLLLTKHQIKYLEKLNADGKRNGIEAIAEMDIRDTYFRDNLIKGECNAMLEKYGRGKVEVYISKDI